MKMYDKVVSKKLGPPVAGTIIGIVDIKEAMPTSSSQYKYFSSVYPDFSILAYVKAPEPIATVTYEEFLMLNEEAINANPNIDLRLEYLNSVKYSRVLTYPIDDLELL